MNIFTPQCACSDLVFDMSSSYTESDGKGFSNNECVSTGFHLSGKNYSDQTHRVSILAKERHS